MGQWCASCGVVSQNLKRAVSSPRFVKKSAVMLTVVRKCEIMTARIIRARAAVGDRVCIGDPWSNHSAFIRPRARSDDEGLRHEARQRRCLALSKAVACPGFVSAVHSAFGLGDSTQRSRRAGASNAIR